MLPTVRVNKPTKIAGVVLAVFLMAVVGCCGLIYSQQDRMVTELIERLNHDFRGRLSISGSHISPFKSFPYISIDLEGVQIFEDKTENSEVLLHALDVYVGFDLFDILGGETTVKRIHVEEGFISLVQHIDGSFNIVNALTQDGQSEDSEEELHLDLQSIALVNIDVLKFNEETGVMVEAFLEDAETRFTSNNEFIDIGLDSRFIFSLTLEDNTSLLRDKHIDLHTALHFNNTTHFLSIDRSEVQIENALFQLEGDIDVDNDLDLNLILEGKKPNFDLFLAFAPAELVPLLERYDNGGEIYFDARINGPSINGKNPKIDVDFGCRDAFVENTAANKGVNELYFAGHFTNGEKRDVTTMELSIEDFTARPETGNFTGNIHVNNFVSPEIEMQVTSEFDLDFLAKFLDLTTLRDITGTVSLELNFHDIVDLDNPAKAIEKLNESYFTKLKVRDLNFNSTTFHLPVKDVNISATMDGHRANIDQFDLRVGDSDLSVTATVSDLPAILHHTDQPVDAILDIKSSLIDLGEITQGSDSSGINEQLEDLSMRLKFRSSARAFTESPNLPIGEFFIERLHAKFNQYPHELHDFNADVFITEADFNVIDFTGMIDRSDFHFSGNLKNYDLWFAEHPEGQTRIDFNLTSSLLQLEDLFSYGGENYVPEDYRHEELGNLRLHGVADIIFDSTLVRTEIAIDKLAANLKIHPMRFEEFNGLFVIDENKLEVKDLHGTLGNSKFRANLLYYWDSTSSPHSFALESPQLDFDELFAYTPPEKELTPEDHEAGFNIFTLPFSDMDFSFNIDRLKYHRILIEDFALEGRMKANHYVYVDSMSLHTAGGYITLNGYFNGSNPDAIYFSPVLELKNVDLDKLMFKFENFGQDHLVSENLHGKISGSMNGKIHMHADMVPIIDDSDLHMDFTVHNGSLNHYTAFDALSDYFADKNLDQVRFDTLKNSLDLKHGELSIPSMHINSSLGYFELSGKQHTDMTMEYYLRIPWKVVTRAGIQKLFGNKDRDTSEQVDDIQYRTRNMRFLNVKITGTPDEYSITLGKDSKS